MLACLYGIAGLQKRARESEFRRCMLRIQLQSMLKCIHRLRILLIFRIRSAQKVPAIGVVWVDLYDLSKTCCGPHPVSAGLVEQAEVVPGKRVVRILLYYLLKNVPSRIDLGEIEKSDSLVNSRNPQLWVKGIGVLESLQCLLKQLLVHV